MVDERFLNRAAEQPVIVDPKVAKRFLAKVEIVDKDNPDESCWIWTGCTDKKGYGQFWFDGRSQWAHRISHALFVGPIPEDMHVHHNCATKDCVNPKHLETITPSENSLERWDRHKAEEGDAA